TLLGLTAGLLVANAERAKAEKRFQQMRHLAGQVLKLDELVSGLQGSTRARHQIIRISKEYLEALRADARHDQTLALEIGNSYVHLAGAQGLPTHSNLGNSQEAEDSLRKAESIVDQVIASSPSNGKALLTSAEIAEGRMILADSSSRDSQAALAQGRKAAGRLDARLKLGAMTGDDKVATARILFNVALMHKNLDMLHDAVRYARTAASIVPSSPNGLLRTTEGLGLLADSLRMIGDLEGASQAMRQAWAAFHKLPEDGRHWLTRYLLHWREAVILGGGSGGLNLDRPGEALASIGQAWQLIDQAAARDANDSRARILFAQTAREFGALLTPRDPARALAVFDTGIRRLGEVTKNPRARRGEAELLARSSYPLRRLNRPAEAQDRIRKAAAILTELGNYPPATVRPTGDDATVLRASADHLAETGRTQEAARLYQQLLDKISASQTGPEKNLRYAGAVSSLYAALADSHHRSGHAAEARAWSARRLTLWQHWSRQLPANPYIARQLAECER
ncbi:MAG: hypothetical protein JNK48_12700, partial [Bryobacterales bacterium]|nr:hypothetical protein [Bryobacterales bacterium]